MRRLPSTDDREAHDSGSRIMFGDHAPQQYGTIGDAMLTLFVTLTLENLPDHKRGRV